MTIWTLLHAAIKKQKKSLIGLLVLIVVTMLSLSLAVTVYCNSSAVIDSQMLRLGYGTLTAWVSNCEDLEGLGKELEMQEGVEAVRIQPLVFAGYLMNDTVIHPGEIYLSPAMKSSFGAEVGDEIRFELSRADTGLPFTVAGFFEDPFMGSSMVDMKSFLISETDYENVLNILGETSEFNLLGRQGAMMHIFSEESAGLSIIELNRILNEQTSLGMYSEMMYSRETIYGFMLLLQNILAGFLIAFSGLLLIVILIVLANLIKNTLEQEYADIGILKTVGCSGAAIRSVQVLRYICPVIAGSVAGAVLAIPIAHVARNLTVTSTGILMSGNLPGTYLAAIFLLVICVIAVFILVATKPVLSIRPLQAITGQSVPHIRIKGKNPIRKGMLGMSLAIRQLLTGWRRYAGVLIVTALLTLFASVVGRMEAWVGPSGEGLMNSFSVAEHDLGIRPAVSGFDMAPVEELINSYSPITDVYRIAMQNGSVNGVDYTINVLDKPEWFHILAGEAAAGEYVVSGIYECANGMGANVGMSINGYARIGNIQEDIWCYHYIIEDGSLRDTVMDALGFRSETGAIDVLMPAFVITVLAFIFAWFFGRQMKTVSVTRLLQDE